MVKSSETKEIAIRAVQTTCFPRCKQCMEFCYEILADEKRVVRNIYFCGQCKIFYKHQHPSGFDCMEALNE